MAKSLSEQLFQAGLVSEKQFKEEEARKTLELEPKRLGKDGPAYLEDMDCVDDADELRGIIKRVLTNDPTLIGPVIQKFHQVFNNKPGSKKLKWVLYQLRDAMRTTPEQKHTRLFEIALRKHDPKFRL
jgi:hypothetical protein